MTDAEWIAPAAYEMAENLALIAGPDHHRTAGR